LGKGWGKVEGICVGFLLDFERSDPKIKDASLFLVGFLFSILRNP